MLQLEHLNTFKNAEIPTFFQSNQWNNQFNSKFSHFTWLQRFRTESEHKNAFSLIFVSYRLFIVLYSVCSVAQMLLYPEGFCNFFIFYNRSNTYYRFLQVSEFKERVTNNGVEEFIVQTYRWRFVWLLEKIKGFCRVDSLPNFSKSF